MRYTKQELKQFSKNQLIEIVLRQQELIEKHMTQIEILELRISKLEKDSHNSFKPPSSDINKQNTESKKPNKSLRPQSNRKPGGQPGHTGVTRAWNPEPDKIEDCRPITCSGCGASLVTSLATVVEKRQEVDIPEIKPTVTEYHKMTIQCSCGCHNEGMFPSHINGPVQIGRNAQTFLIYLNVSQLIPLKRLQVLCLDLFAFPLCKRSIENILERAREKGAPIITAIKAIIQKSRWVGSDETGCYVDGKRWWQWTWQSIKATYYAVDPSRGYSVVVKHFGEVFMGILLHDCWPAQNNTKASGHQQCLAHIQRELKFLIEDCHVRWAYYLNKLLGAAQRARDRIWADGFDPNERQIIINRFEKALDKFLHRNLKNPDAIRLQKRFIKHRASILLFMNYPDVPFHNNSSERAIRMAKVKQKISGCFRSQKGAERYATLLSIIETAKKQDMNLFDAIKKLIDGTLVFHGT